MSTDPLSEDILSHLLLSVPFNLPRIPITGLFCTSACNTNFFMHGPVSHNSFNAAIPCYIFLRGQPVRTLSDDGRGPIKWLCCSFAYLLIVGEGDSKKYKANIMKLVFGITLDGCGFLFFLFHKSSSSNGAGIKQDNVKVPSAPTSINTFPICDQGPVVNKPATM